MNDLQRQLTVSSVSATPFALPDYDEASFTATRDALLELGKGLGGLERCFGTKEAVDPIRHLIGTALGWGGLPEHEASYITVSPGLEPGHYALTVGDVPVDGFWSISLYNAEGFFEENAHGAYNVNNITGEANEDGTITVNFGGDATDRNPLPVMEGWNYLVRLYRPREEILNGTWTFPTLAEAKAS